MKNVKLVFRVELRGECFLVIAAIHRCSYQERTDIETKLRDRYRGAKIDRITTVDEVVIL